MILAVWVCSSGAPTEPLADVELLARPPVLMTNIATLLVGFGMFGSFILIPQLVEAPESTGYGFGLDATGAGLLMLPGALVMLVAGPLSGRARTRFGGKVPLALGAFVSAAGLLLMALDHGTQGAMVAWNIVLSIGIGLAFAAMPNLIIDAVPQSETGEATGFNTLVRSVGASLGSQVSGRRARRQRRRGRRAAHRRRLHDRVPGLRRRRDRGRGDRAPDPARPRAGSGARRRPPGMAYAERMSRARRAPARTPSATTRA